MDGEDNRDVEVCPASLAAVVARAREVLEELLSLCQEDAGTFAEFEQRLRPRLDEMGRELIRLFLTARHERLDVCSPLQCAGYRLGHPNAKRQLKTAYGVVSYGRARLMATTKGCGYHPLDVELGLTRDGFSPWVISWVTRLATRMSYASARSVCKTALSWSPSTEAIEQLVLGLGRWGATFEQQQKPPASAADEVLVIEVDGKCPPTATAAELAKRRGPRRSRPNCPCRCQRHRGQQKRQALGSKKRRKKGDKSKNGKEVVVIVMYTLRRGAEGRLHGPFDKKVWGSFAGRKAAARWARAAASQRGFGPDTTKTVQIVLDGAKGLKQNLQPLFPQAIFTVDVCHVVEKLWAMGRHYHPEASAPLKRWVGKLKKLLYEGRSEELLERLRRLQEQASRHGPGTKARRLALKRLIGYLQPRQDMLRYGEWRAQDLVIATGQVEGAVRHLVGERMDCAGMRWIPQRAEALLHLRCIEINGDWDAFVTWVYNRFHQQLRERLPIQIRTNEPITLARAA